MRGQRSSTQHPVALSLLKLLAYLMTSLINVPFRLKKRKQDGDHVVALLTVSACYVRAQYLLSPNATH